MKPLIRSGEITKMIAIDGSYLYKVGSSVHPIDSLSADWTYGQAWFPLYVAEGELERFITSSVFRLPTSQPNAQALITTCRTIREKGDANATPSEKMSPYDVYLIKNALSAFETVFSAEFAMASIYLVVPKRGYETRSLIDNGIVLFPEDLAKKVPKAIPDINQAARCIAFELPTAAGFHLHRANESVLHCYFDVVTSNAAHPKTRNIGDYLSELSKLNKGDPKIISALKDLKDLHRNPLIHPQDSLESVDEALALLGSIHAAMVHMLKAMPSPQVPAISSASATPSPPVSNVAPPRPA